MLTAIGSQTLPNPVRVPSNIIQPGVLILLMEGPLRPWQCLVYANQSPSPYQRSASLGSIICHSHTLLQIGPAFNDQEISEGEGVAGGREESVEL